MTSSIHRSHTCNDISALDVGKRVRLSGWIHRKRDHGHVFFVDLRDHYGITQCVFGEKTFERVKHVPLESVISVEGEVVRRTPETVNAKLNTGEVEVQAETLEVLSQSAPLPFPVNLETECPEDTRLKYRYLDLRRERMHKNIVLRSRVISSIRQRMIAQNFQEIQTPILTASSPEGARDFLVPSRLHPGEFYALPQAPQLFKQLLMVSGFDRYFQIAPCFRDEDPRADRSPGEFYQLDFEMAFATQEDVFAALEPVLHGVFTEFGNGASVTPMPFPRIPYEESMLLYGSDKPDLRNPLRLSDLTSVLTSDESPMPFAETLSKGGVVRGLFAPGFSTLSRSTLKELTAWAIEHGAPGLGYIIFEGESFKGPLVKFFSDTQQAALRARYSFSEGDGLLFVCDTAERAAEFGGKLRDRVCRLLGLLDEYQFAFCWITDYPMYEKDPDGKIIFSHNPFSMPQGGLEALETQDPLTIKAYQYDVVCNGIELSSGAIRNHVPEIMYKAFEIAGYDREHVEMHFGGLLNAFRYGAPPHGGSAPGIDRIVMLLANEPNLREIICFPLNQQARDPMMNAPSPAEAKHLQELCLKIISPTKDK